MLNDESRTLCVQNPSLHDLCGDDSLLGVEVGRWFINKVDVTWFTKGENNSNTLKLTTGECLNLIIHQLVDSQWTHDLTLKQSACPVIFEFQVEKLLDGTLELGSDGLWLKTD